MSIRSLISCRFLPIGAMFLVCISQFTPLFARKLKTVAGVHATFTSYKTYQWLPVKTLGKAGTVEDDAMIATIIRSAVEREMAALGLTQVKEGADLQIAAFASTTSIPQLEAVIFPGDMWMDFETPIAMMGRYNKEGTL